MWISSVVGTETETITSVNTQHTISSDQQIYIYVNSIKPLNKIKIICLNNENVNDYYSHVNDNTKTSITTTTTCA